MVLRLQLYLSASCL